MAGILKPSGAKSEATYKLWGYKMYDPAENGFNGSLTVPSIGPFVGTYNRTSIDALYWYNDTTNYMDIEVYSSCNIHAYMISEWVSGYSKRLNIYDNPGGVKGPLVGKTTNGYGSLWNLIYTNLPKGRYRIELDPTDTAYSYHGDKEWYLESVDVKYLIQNGSDLYTVNTSLYNKIGQTPATEAQFLANGFTDLSQLTTAQVKNTAIGIDKGTLGTGKYFSIPVQPDFKSISAITLM